MQAFLDNARVQVSNNGLYFYEKDIIMSKYLFNRDLRIDISLEYNRSGFGIFIGENTNDDINDITHSYLFHLGTNKFSCVEKHLLQKGETSVRSNVLSPQLDTVIDLRVIYSNRRIYIYQVKQVDNKESLIELGTYGFSRKFSTYYVGLYSNAGNTIRDVTFLQGIPNHWHVSIANVHGGRISFWDDGFMFEDCIHDAELEQKEFTLPVGKYWFQYDTEKVNDKFDIEGFIYEARVPTPPRNLDLDTEYSDAMPTPDRTGTTHLHAKAAFDEKYFEDEGKNIIVDQRGFFELYRETTLVVSFKGTNGKVSHVTVKDDPNGEFVATDDDIVTTEGSWIEILLDNVKKVAWQGIVYAIPVYEDHSKKCPYGLIVTDSNRVQLADLSIDLNKQYDYVYMVEDKTLNVTDEETDLFSASYPITLLDSDNNTIKIFFNVKAQITNLTLTMEDGTEINTNIQKEIKKFVPGYITGPIIVTDDNDNSFDLSASFREVVKSNCYHIDYFSKYATEIKLSYPTNTTMFLPQVFGIPKGATITTGETDIAKFVTNYTQISNDLVSVVGNVITIPSAVRDDYEYIAVRYQRANKYSYIFTNYEREIFDGDEDIFALQSMLNESGQGITVYGLQTRNFNAEYLYRIPNKDMEESIDLCADMYDMISPTLYTVNTEDSTIKINKVLKDKYSLYIVDYLKKDSYSINWNSAYQQYEVDISTDNESVKIHYELNSGGVSNTIIRTDIEPDASKFVILRRKKGAFLSED